MKPTSETSRARPQLEALEGRLVPSATISNGTLVIHGTAGADRVIVQQGRFGLISVSDNGALSVYGPGAFRAISFWGGDGNDRFENNTGLPCWAFGQGGADTLIGGSGNDTLEGAGL